MSVSMAVFPSLPAGRGNTAMPQGVDIDSIAWLRR